MVEKRKDGIVGIGSKNLYVLSGTCRQAVNGKFEKIPSGLALDMLYGKLNRFSIKDFIDAHKSRFPILKSTEVLKASAAQEILWQREKIDVSDLIKKDNLKHVSKS